ncbi:exonuclease SbcC [Tumebacillus sp. BK434]|uniref:AAA family ATPase n=1 Tax=Tumebacillus sp. BK434 TaxID=2512169 RepID=UPI00104BA062|nr:AAA family ATPase [Tumebacillus sp. BK434]TCP53697.1 exonuclease SbcC [Tumebacillus sp. BK434]
MNLKTIRNLRIENFQSHELTEMAFDDGLNVIVGASDNGKSAVIRALRWLLYNEPRGSDFMRVGATQCRVMIELADGSRVTRERTPSKNRYIVMQASGEEQIYEGFGNTVPKEVSDLTGVRKVALDEDNETPLHLGTQLEPPFLLSEPGSIKAKAIGRLNGVHIIDAASRDTNRDLTRANADERGFREQLTEVEQELEQFSDLPYLENILLLVEEKQTARKDLSARLLRLQALAKKRQAVQSDLSEAEQVLARTAHLDLAALQAERAITLQSKALRLQQARNKRDTVADGIARTDVVLQRTAGLGQAEQELGTSETLLARFHRLSKLGESRAQLHQLRRRVEAVLQRTEGLADAEQRVHRLEASKHRLMNLHLLRTKRSDTGQLLARIDRVLELTQGTPELGGRLDLLDHKRLQAQKLRDLVVKKADLSHKLQALQNMLAALAKTERAEWALEQLVMLTGRQQLLIKMNEDLFDLGDRLRKADQYLKANALEITEKLAEYSEALKRSGSCPVCFAPIDEHTTERLLDEFKGGLPHEHSHRY